MQKRLKLRPEVDLEIEIKGTQKVGVGKSDTLLFRYALDSPEPKASESKETRPLVRFRLNAGILLMILLNAAVWNNVEIAALVECERTPDHHDPIVHSLMSYFTL